MSLEAQKKQAAYRALEYIKDGMAIGIGTGSTVKYFIEGLGELVSKGMKFRTVATSLASEELAKKHGISVETLATLPVLDITIDGADEIDHDFNLIKGGGGALLREKIVAYASKQVVIIADSSKYVDTLGVFPLPVEVVPYGAEATKYHIEKLGCKAVVRQKDGKDYLTDNGNIILDCLFDTISDPPELENVLNMIPGVVENGLFVGLATRVVLATDQGERVLERS